MYQFTEKEQQTVLAVFSTLVQMNDSKLNTFLGSLTIAEMKALYLRLHYSPFCEKYGIKYDDMDEDDFIRAWEEECEQARIESEGWDD